MELAKAWRDFLEAGKGLIHKGSALLSALLDGAPQLREGWNQARPHLLQYNDALLCLGATWAIWPRPLIAIASTALSLFLMLYIERNGFHAPRLRPEAMEKAFIGIGLLLAPFVFQTVVCAIIAGSLFGSWALSLQQSRGMGQPSPETL
jgi:hypothetical protein